MVDQIERERLLPASPDEVWRVVTGSGWLAAEVRLELVPGGEASFTSEEGCKRGWVEEAVAPVPEEGTGGRLIFWWEAEGEPASRVELRLDPLGTGTRLRVVEARPLEVLDAVGIPLPGTGSASRGPAMVMAA